MERACWSFLRQTTLYHPISCRTLEWLFWFCRRSSHPDNVAPTLRPPWAAGVSWGILFFFEVRWHRSAALTGVAHSCFLSYSLWWQAMSRSVCPKGRWRYANLPSCPRLLLYTLRESDSRETIFGGCWAKTLYEFPKWHRIGRQLTLSNGNSNCFYLSFVPFS